MIKQLNLLIILSLLATVPVAGAEVGDWYVTPSIVYTDDDGDRLIDDSIAGGQLNIGRVMSEHFWLEGMAGYSNIDGFPGQKHLDLGLNVVANLAPYHAFSPYLLGGLGYLGTETRTGVDDNRLSTTAGLGFNWHFGDSAWSLRSEFRWRFAWDNSNKLIDRITSLGLHYSFGRTPTLISTPQPQQAQAPQPQPVPEPVVGSDADGDGVADSRDECPDTPRSIAVNAAGCPADSDLDGVTDDKDRCPGTVAGVRADSQGCEIREIIDLPGVYFANDSDVIVAGSDKALADAAATLLKNPGLRVEIAGHTDSKGDADDNMNLSLRRAFAVRGYLIQAGVNPANLTTRGYGESAPVASNLTEAGMAENRRVELRILNR